MILFKWKRKKNILFFKYCEKSVETNEGNLRHLKISHRFFFKVVVEAIKMNMTF